jgi:hypothetical protein
MYTSTVCSFFLTFSNALKRYFKNWEHMLPGAKTPRQILLILHHHRMDKKVNI